MSQVGWHESGMAGPQPTRWTELLAFVELCGLVLEPWEVELMGSASREFVNAFHEMNGRLVPIELAPFPFQLEGEDLVRAERWVEGRLEKRI